MCYQVTDYIISSALGWLFRLEGNFCPMLKHNQVSIFLFKKVYKYSSLLNTCSIINIIDKPFMNFSIL